MIGAAAETGRDGRTPQPPGRMAAAMATFDAKGGLVARNAADGALFGAAAGLAARLVAGAEASAFLRRVGEGDAASAALACRTARGEARCEVTALPLPGGPVPVAPGFGERPAAGFGVDVAAVAVTFVPLPEQAPSPAVPSVPAERLARIGHELRSPLNAVLGFAEMIRHGGLPAGRTAEYATDIVSAAWRLLRLADDLVGLGETRSGETSLRMGEVDLGRVARRLIRLAWPVATAAGVRIDDAGLRDPGAGPVVFGDESALWSAVDNLLQNAIRHGGSGGTVRVAFLDPGERGGVCLEIADEGPGLARDALAEALAAYGRPGSGGAQRPGGLGLPIVRELVEAHDGELDIETAPGQGFAARIRIPAARCLNW